MPRAGQPSGTAQTRIRIAPPAHRKVRTRMWTAGRDKIREESLINPVTLQQVRHLADLIRAVSARTLARLRVRRLRAHRLVAADQ